jgi:hypothetical protein
MRRGRDDSLVETLCGARGGAGSVATMDVPTIETERLVMRAFSGDDFEAMVPFYASDVSKFYGGPCNRELAWRKFAMYPGHWVLRGYGPWMIESKADGAVVGLCGPWFPDGWVEPELTWALVPGHHGKGYASIAVRVRRSRMDDGGQRDRDRQSRIGARRRARRRDVRTRRRLPLRLGVPVPPSPANRVRSTASTTRVASSG